MSDCLIHLGVAHSLALWILNFLQNQKQVVKIYNNFSRSLAISTGAPQGCVMSPLLFSLYTNHFTSQHSSVKTFKFADDTTITAYREDIALMTSWCLNNNLHLNVSKKREMIIDFRKGPIDIEPLAINGQEVEQVVSFKFLGTTISSSLKWTDNTTAIIGKAHQ
ncbi:hypothetical protein LDENG_00101850 [Lucifuga dentata]|nr:hypothetical protein LDENG_00101850 [Lucifuga dentata]